MCCCISQGLFVCQKIRHVFKQQSNHCSAILGLGSLVASLTTNTALSKPCEAEVGYVSIDKVDTKIHCADTDTLQISDNHTRLFCNSRVSINMFKVYWPGATRWNF